MLCYVFRVRTLPASFFSFSFFIFFFFLVPNRHLHLHVNCRDGEQNGAIGGESEGTGRRDNTSREDLSAAGLWRSKSRSFFNIKIMRWNTCRGDHLALVSGANDGKRQSMESKPIIITCQDGMDTEELQIDSSRAAALCRLRAQCSSTSLQEHRRLLRLPSIEANDGSRSCCA